MLALIITLMQIVTDDDKSDDGDSNDGDGDDNYWNGSSINVFLITSLMYIIYYFRR